jgi:pimeloyl-ACP methyl ester carboxylesterase
MRLSSIFAVGLLWLAAPHGAYSELATEDCRLSSTWLATVSAQCGVLSVPEDPANPDGRQIELFVARIPALSGTPEPDPVVLISGGPGQATTELYLALRPAFEPLRREREIIVLDQRGTGRSNRLGCPSANADDLEISDLEQLRTMVSTCVADLDDDPRYYTTSVAVRDLERLRQALEVEEWNIYGISYGTRVAQHYLRRYPQRARAVIIDGVIPSELALGPAIATNAQASLEQILSRCAESAPCAAAFPDLPEKLETIRARLAQGPVQVSMPDPISGQPVDRVFSDRHLQTAIRLMSYAPPTAALLPLQLNEAYNGNYAPLTAQAYMMIGELAESLSFPMHNAVACTEDVPFFDSSELENLEATYLGTAVIDALLTVCSVWPVGELDGDLKEPLVSSTPTLLLSGEADPVTPPAYAEQVLVNLSSARHLIGPGQGHGLAAVGCVPNLMRRFLQELDPLGLDAECLDREQPSPFFLDFSGPSP